MPPVMGGGTTGVLLPAGISLLAGVVGPGCIICTGAGLLDCIIGAGRLPLPPNGGGPSGVSSALEPLHAQQKASSAPKPTFRETFPIAILASIADCQLTRKGSVRETFPAALRSSRLTAQTCSRAAV